MYTCIIVDDQQAAVDMLAEHIKKVPPLTVRLAETDPLKALSFLDKEKPDIIFLDIDMPGMSGIDIVEILKDKCGYSMPKIVFTTAHEEFALKGFEYGVIDYILKPVTFSRFKKSVDRIINTLDKHTAGNPLDFFFVDVYGEKIRINFADIIYIEGARNYVSISTTLKKLTVYNTVTNMMEVLPVDRFIRVHKSFIVAIEKIKAIMGNRILVNEKDNTKHIPIGVTYRKDVNKKLGIA